MTRSWLAVVLALCLAVTAQGQKPDALPPAKLPGESSRTALRLAEAQKRVEREQWPEAVDEYCRIIEEAGDDLIPLNPQDPRHCIRARQVCHSRLAALPAAARKLYRGRVDDRAKKWLEQGSAGRDALLLRRIVEETFCSQHTDRALDLLGDLAFEEGDFAEAERWWRMLALPASEAKPDPKSKLADWALVFPEPQVDLALVRAKQVLCRLYQGDKEAKELKAFAAAHAKAEGRLAGRSGNLSATLQALLEQSKVLQAPAEELAWSTFAGDASRSLILPKAPRCRWLDEPWRVSLASTPPPAKDTGKVLTATQLAGAMAFHPVVVGNQVVVANASAVMVFDLFTGQRLARCDLQEDLHLTGAPSPPLPIKNNVRFTLTVAGNRIYVRLGSIGLGSPPNGAADRPRDARESYLVCLDLPDRTGKLPLVWHKAARVDDKDASFFEGSPVVRNDALYVARTQFTIDRAATAIECYSAAKGTLRWRQDVCDGQEQREGASRHRHHLLTLAGPLVVYCSHSGAVVALDATTGKRAWAIRYPRSERASELRDLAPCVYSQGRLFVAPADCDHILCLDAGNGRTLWESPPLEVGHLLGVAQGKLIFTTASWPRCIRALDAASGQDQRGWMQPDGDAVELATIGRGLLAGDSVFWPTQNGLRILNQEDGQQSAIGYVPLAGVEPGNLAAGNGCLVIATAKELLGYVPAGHKIKERQKGAAPRTAAAHFRLGRAQADLGLLAQAIDEFAKAEERAGLDERWHGASLREQARRHRHDLLLDLTREEESRGRRDQAVAHLNRAAAAEFPVPLRLRATTSLAGLWERAKEPARAVQAWQTILSQDDLRRGTIHTSDGAPQQAGYLACQRIAGLIQTQGKEVYAPIETQAGTLLQTANQAQLPSICQRLALEFPNSSAAASALWQLAGQQEKAKQPEAAADTLRLLVRRSEAPNDRIQSLKRLAVAYEDQRSWQAAHATWQRLSDEFGKDNKALTADVVRAMEKPDYHQPRQPNHPDLGLPLGRSWQVSLASNRAKELPLLSSPGPSADKELLLFVTEGQSLICRDAATGKQLWHSRLEGSIRWVARHAGLVLAAGDRQVACLRALDGQVFWNLSALHPELAVAGTSPPECEPFAAFNLSAGRLFFLQGQRRLFAIDIESGAVLWSQWAPGGSVRPLAPQGQFFLNYYAGPQRVVMQTSSGKCWLLNSRTGRKIHESATSREPWAQPPLAVDDHQLCLAPDNEHVFLMDLATGKEIWRQDIGRSSSLTGQPLQVRVNGQALLVLVSRNSWNELERLDVQTGKRGWPRPVLLDGGRIDLGGSAVDDTTLYFATETALQAIRLADGKPLWAVPLPGGYPGWQVIASRSYLLAYPRQAHVELSRSALLRRRIYLDPAAIFPTPTSHGVGTAFAGIAISLEEARAASRLSLLLCDSKTGQLIQRLNFTSQGPAATVAVFNRGLAVVMADSAWGLR